VPPDAAEPAPAAAEPVAAAGPAPDADTGAPVEAPVVKKKRPHKRPGTRTPPEPVDLGKSRF